MCAGHAAGKPYEAIDGWCTLKFLTKVAGKVPVPAAGALPAREWYRSSPGRIVSGLARNGTRRLPS